MIVVSESVVVSEIEMVEESDETISVISVFVVSIIVASESVIDSGLVTVDKSDVIITVVSVSVVSLSVV